MKRFIVLYASVLITILHFCIIYGIRDTLYIFIISKLTMYKLGNCDKLLSYLYRLIIMSWF